jgi:sporulation protein YlmC with PRC-barrel domain
MFAKYITTGLIGSALLTTVAFAQSPTTTTDRAGAAPMAPASTSSFQGDWRTSKVIGLSVYNDKNESVGSINDLLTDKSGNIKAAVISVGGFLGVGSQLVAVPFDKVKFVSEPVPYSAAAGSPGASGASTTTTGAATTGTATTPTTPASAAKPDPWAPDHAVFNATKDELKAMPEFKYSTN